MHACVSQPTNCVNQELHDLLDPHLTIRGSCHFTGNKKHHVTAFGYRPDCKKAKCMYWFTNVWGDDVIDDYEESNDVKMVCSGDDSDDDDDDDGWVTDDDDDSDDERGKIPVLLRGIECLHTELYF